MCTLSLIRAPFREPDEPTGLRWRLVFNRDERRDRAEAEPPLLHRYGGVSAVHPLDPQGQGTWIAATSAGLAFALLNETGLPARGTASASVSRGRVIPGLLDATSLDEAESRLRRLPPGRHGPFRLVVVSDDGLLEVVDAAARTSSRHLPAPTFMRTSSSVAPAMARMLRTGLFGALVPASDPSAQDRFHAHTWPGAPGASVLMSRAEAATVSVTTIEAFAQGFRLTYRPWPGGAEDVTDMARAA